VDQKKTKQLLGKETATENFKRLLLPLQEKNGKEKKTPPESLLPK
jgi:hypothetical protein